MVKICGYSITEYPNENKLVITLPQTTATTTNTIAPLSLTRKESVDSTSLARILVAVIAEYENH